jgi:hypothetical protein
VGGERGKGRDIGMGPGRPQASEDEQKAGGRLLQKIHSLIATEEGSGDSWVDEEWGVWGERAL